MITRAPRPYQFTSLPTAAFNLTMPPAELGVYLHLLSKPDDWSINGVYLRNHFKMSKDKTYRILEALVTLGFITKATGRTEEGRMETVYTVHEPSPEKQDRSCFTGPGNQDVLKTESTSTSTPPDCFTWKPTKETTEVLRLRGIVVAQGWVEEFLIWAKNPEKEVTPNNIHTKFINWCKFEKVNTAVLSGKMPTVMNAPMAHKEAATPEPVERASPETIATARKALAGLTGSKRVGGDDMSLEERKREARRRLGEHAESC